MDNQLAQYVLYSTIAQFLWALFFLGTCAGIWYGIFRLLQTLKRIEDSLNPVAGRGQEILNQVDHTLTMVRDRAETIMNTGEKVAEKVAARVDTTSSMIEGVITRPIIRVKSLTAGVNAALRIWRQSKPGKASKPTKPAQPLATVPDGGMRGDGS